MLNAVIAWSIQNRLLVLAKNDTGAAILRALPGLLVTTILKTGELLLTLGTPGVRGDGTGPLLAEPNDVITAPDGTILVAEAQEVKAGEMLAVVEAMKMENVLRAERDLTVAKINAKPGDSLAVDAVIMEFV